jgi:hypothetical protein
MAKRRRASDMDCSRRLAGVRQRDQALVGQVAVRTPGAVAGELGDVLLDAGDGADVGLLDVEVQRARDRVVAAGDAVEGRGDAVDHGALDLVGVLIQEAEAEDAHRLGVGLELLHDQVVVLAGLDIGAVLTHGVADRLVLGLLVGLLHGAIQSKVLQPPSIASSAKASRVPEVGGGPRTSMATSGRSGLTSFQVL